MNKAFFHLDLSKFQVQLREILKIITTRGSQTLELQNYLFKNFVDKQSLKRKGEVKSVNLLSILAKHNVHVHQNQTSRNIRKNYYSNLWIFSDLLPTGKGSILKRIENIFSFIKRENCSFIHIYLLPNYCIQRNSSIAINLRYSHPKQKYGDIFQNHLLQPNTTEFVNFVTQRYFSSCDKKKKINPKLEHYKMNRDKYPPLCKHRMMACLTKKKKRRKPIYGWLCSLIGCGKKKEAAMLKGSPRCCTSTCKDGKKTLSNGVKKSPSEEEKKSDIKKTSKIAPSSLDSPDIKKSESTTECKDDPKSKTATKECNNDQKTKDNKLDDLCKKNNDKEVKICDDKKKKKPVPCIEQPEPEQKGKQICKPCGLKFKESKAPKSLKTVNCNKTDNKELKKTSSSQMEADSKKSKGILCSEQNKIPKKTEINLCKPPPCINQQPKLPTKDECKKKTSVQTHQSCESIKKPCMNQISKPCVYYEKTDSVQKVPSQTQSKFDKNECKPIITCNLNITEYLSKATEKLRKAKNEKVNLDKQYQLSVTLSECHVKKNNNPSAICKKPVSNLCAPETTQNTIVQKSNSLKNLSEKNLSEANLVSTETALKEHESEPYHPFIPIHEETKSLENLTEKNLSEKQLVSTIKEIQSEAYHPFILNHEEKQDKTEQIFQHLSDKKPNDMNLTDKETPEIHEKITKLKKFLEEEENQELYKKISNLQKIIQENEAPETNEKITEQKNQLQPDLQAKPSLSEVKHQVTSTTPPKDIQTFKDMSMLNENGKNDQHIKIKLPSDQYYIKQPEFKTIQKPQVGSRSWHENNHKFFSKKYKTLPAKINKTRTTISDNPKTIRRTKSSVMPQKYKKIEKHYSNLKNKIAFYRDMAALLPERNINKRKVKSERTKKHQEKSGKIKKNCSHSPNVFNDFTKVVKYGKVLNENKKESQYYKPPESYSELTNIRNGKTNKELTSKTGMKTFDENVNGIHVNGNKKLKTEHVQNNNFLERTQKLRKELHDMKDLQLLSHKTQEFCKIMLELVQLFSEYKMNSEMITCNKSIETLKMKQQKIQELRNTIKSLEQNLQEFLQNSDKPSEQKIQELLNKSDALTKPGINKFEYYSYTNTENDPPFEAKKSKYNLSDAQKRRNVYTGTGEYQSTKTKSKTLKREGQSYNVKISSIEELRRMLLDLVFLFASPDETCNRRNAIIQNKHLKRKYSS